MRSPRSLLPQGRRVRGLAAVAGVAAFGAAAAVAPTSDAPVSAAPPGARPVVADHAPPASIESPPLSEQLKVQAAAEDDTREAPSPTEAPSPAEPTESAEPAEPARSVWDRLADCESGEWTGDGGFVQGSANWSATAGTFEGGLQFHPGTWDGFKDPGMPAAAYEASRAQQVAIAERVLDAQGWKAWPVCSRKLGLR